MRKRRYWCRTTIVLYKRNVNFLLTYTVHNNIVNFSVFHNPYNIQDDGVIWIKVNDPKISTFLSASHISWTFDEGEEIVLIETQFLRDLLNLCTTRQGKGVVIRGPSGTGKTTSAIYLVGKLSSKTPLLLCSPRCYKSNRIFYGYIEAFCKGNNCDPL